MEDYDKIISERAGRVFQIMETRVSASDMDKIREAFNFARVAHASQKRKTGEPYILHPIAVADIAAEELCLDVSSVIAAFLHDVVEDTEYTIEDIRSRFGDDVAFLVSVVTKKKKDRYVDSLQVDNFRQMLDSVQYDIRALLVKRTLSSMRPDKQMKIAGETDYFYAPLANRLGFYNVKTELENLSFRFRCPHEYEELKTLIARDEEAQRDRLNVFCREIEDTLAAAGLKARVYVEYRHPYSVWRKMHKYGDDFNHLKYRHFTDVVFEASEEMSEKEMALCYYSVLTDHFREKPGGITNYIDSPKENGYQSFHVKLLAHFGRWQEVHISSERMIRDSQLGCVADRSEDNIRRWIEKFRKILRDIARNGKDGQNFIEKVVTSFYNDDIMTFTRAGQAVVLPQKATILDFAYEIGREVGENAKYGRLNGFLASVKAPLRRGDVVEVFTDPNVHPSHDWLDSCVTYKAKQAIADYLAGQPQPAYHRCPECNPIPGEEVIGFREEDGSVTVHKRDCPSVIKLASQYGDRIESVAFSSDSTLYPVQITVKAIDRYHLFIDLADCISNQLNLSIDSIQTDTVDNIVTINAAFGVHDYNELQSIMTHVASIHGVDEVKRK